MFDNSLFFLENPFQNGQKLFSHLQTLCAREHEDMINIKQLRWSVAIPFDYDLFFFSSIYFCNNI